MQKALATIWIFGDQLNRKIGALATAKPETHRILIVESAGKIASRPWHIQRAHFLITSMRRFAIELQQAGFEVDYRRATTMRAGVESHIAECGDELARRVTVGLRYIYICRRELGDVGFDARAHCGCAAIVDFEAGLLQFDRKA
ncbi:MAG: cryptochrome/photolyase family protein, partial [Acidimicrobiaceae bacterium]